MKSPLAAASPAVNSIDKLYIRAGVALLLLATSLCAQTHVSSQELPSVTGAVTGPFANVTLRDINSARDHGDGQTNGIASAIAGCGTTITCSIIVPPTYGVAELAPGYSFNPASSAAAATTSGNITIFDRRYGDARIAVNPTGFHNGLVTVTAGWIYDYYTRAPRASVQSLLYILQNSWDGGNNQQNTSLNFTDKTQWSPLVLTSHSYTPGQHITSGVTTLNSSLGNTIAISNQVYCWGGLNAQGDQGCRAMDNKALQGNVEYAGTLTGSPFANATTITVAPTQGAATQGAGRFIVKTNAGTLSSGTIANVVSTFNALTVVTGAGTSWPVSTVVAQLGTAVPTLGTTTVTPNSFTAGSMSLISTSTLVCIADAESFEMVYPTSVSSTGFTASFGKPHLANSTIAVGGVCGYLLDLTADDVTSSTYPVHSQTVIGTLHFAWPLVYSTSASSAAMWVAGAGAYQSIVSRFDPNSANGYMLYPFAEVLSVQQNGGLSNTLALGANKVSWSAGDTVSEFLYPSFAAHGGNNVIESYYPNMAANGHNFGLIYNSPLQGVDTMMALVNNAPSSFYSINGGKYNSPLGVHVQGPTKNGVYFDTPSDQSTLGIGCSLTCASIENVLAAANPYYYDFVQYDEANSRWSLSAGVNAVHYTFGPSRFDTPMPRLFMSLDNSNVGYLSVQSLRSGVSSNTDISGELTVAGASSATYTFFAGYTSHPECFAKPQSDIGSGNRYWITYSGQSSFTVSFSSPTTTTISYSCTGRN